ncbi:MAG: response regulator [Myxococcales bacterium]|nr:response regulator [Myxococcales bacterium]
MPILIVDDNPQNLKLARVALECEGFEVRTATDGEAAIELVRRAPAHPDGLSAGLGVKQTNATITAVTATR